MQRSTGMRRRWHGPQCGRTLSHLTLRLLHWRHVFTFLRLFACPSSPVGLGWSSDAIMDGCSTSLQFWFCSATPGQRDRTGRYGCGGVDRPQAEAGPRSLAKADSDRLGRCGEGGFACHAHARGLRLSLCFCFGAARLRMPARTFACLPAVCALLTRPGSSPSLAFSAVYCRLRPSRCERELVVNRAAMVFFVLATAEASAGAVFGRAHFTRSRRALSRTKANPPNQCGTAKANPNIRDSVSVIHETRHTLAWFMSRPTSDSQQPLFPSLGLAWLAMRDGSHCSCTRSTRRDTAP